MCVCVSSRVCDWLIDPLSLCLYVCVWLFVVIVLRVLSVWRLLIVLVGSIALLVLCVLSWIGLDLCCLVWLDAA